MPRAVPGSTAAGGVAEFVDDFLDEFGGAGAVRGMGLKIEKIAFAI